MLKRKAQKGISANSAAVAWHGGGRPVVDCKISKMCKVNRDKSIRHKSTKAETVRHFNFGAGMKL